MSRAARFRENPSSAATKTRKYRGANENPATGHFRFYDLRAATECPPPALRAGGGSAPSGGRSAPTPPLRGGLAPVRGLAPLRGAPRFKKVQVLPGAPSWAVNGAAPADVRPPIWLQQLAGHLQCCFTECAELQFHAEVREAGRAGQLSVMCERCAATWAARLHMQGRQTCAMPCGPLLHGKCDRRHGVRDEVRQRPAVPARIRPAH